MSNEMMLIYLNQLIDNRCFMDFDGKAYDCGIDPMVEDTGFVIDWAERWKNEKIAQWLEEIGNE